MFCQSAGVELQQESCAAEMKKFIAKAAAKYAHNAEFSAKLVTPAVGKAPADTRDRKWLLPTGDSTTGCNIAADAAGDCSVFRDWWPTATNILTETESFVAVERTTSRSLFFARLEAAPFRALQTQI